MTTPTIPVTPATDEEVEEHRSHYRRAAPIVLSGASEGYVTVAMRAMPDVPALIARIDALKAERDAERGQKEQALRAFRAEAERQRLADEETALFIAKRAGWLDPTDHAALLTDLKKAETERDAERAARERAEADLKEQGDRCTERWEAEHKRANAAEAETAAMFKAWGGCKGECTRSTRERDEWKARAEKAEAERDEVGVQLRAAQDWIARGGFSVRASDGGEHCALCRGDLVTGHLSTCPVGAAIQMRAALHLVDAYLDAVQGEPRYDGGLHARVRSALSRSTAFLRG